MTSKINRQKEFQVLTKGPGAKNDTTESPGCFNQILTFESQKWSPLATIYHMLQSTLMLENLPNLWQKYRPALRFLMSDTQ